MTSLSLLAPTLTAGVLLSLLSLLSLLLCLSWAGSSSVPCVRVTCSISSAQLSLNALGTALWLSCCCSPVVLAVPMLLPAPCAPQLGSHAQPGPPGPPRGTALLELAALSAAPPRSCLQEQCKHELMVPGFPPGYTALPRAALE